MMNTRRGKGQLQFSGAEITALAVSFVLTSTFVFLLGFYVGKKNAAEHVPRDERVARIPVDDFSKYARPAAGTAESSGPDARSTEDAPPSAPVHRNGAHAKGEAGRAEAAAQTKPDAAPAHGDAARTGAATGTPEAVAAAGDKAEAAGKARSPLTDDAAKATAAPVKADAAATGADSAADRKAEAKAAKAAAKAAEAKAAEARAAEEKAEDKSAKPDEDDQKTSAGGYTVQVLATRKQADAEALVKKLAARGYGAYIKRVSDGHTSWYRVRVGSYGAFGEARTMADHCRRELGLEQAFVSTQ